MFCLVQLAASATSHFEDFSTYRESCPVFSEAPSTITSPLFYQVNTVRSVSVLGEMGMRPPEVSSTTPSLIEYLATKTGASSPPFFAQRNVAAVGPLLSSACAFQVACFDYAAWFLKFITRV